MAATGLALAFLPGAVERGFICLTAAAAERVLGDPAFLLEQRARAPKPDATAGHHGFLLSFPRHQNPAGALGNGELSR